MDGFVVMGGAAFMHHGLRFVLRCTFMCHGLRFMLRCASLLGTDLLVLGRAPATVMACGSGFRYAHKEGRA